MNRLSTLLFLTSALQAAAPPELSSQYTDLSQNGCAPAKEDTETGAASRLCPGVGGYRLLVHDEDSRMSVSVIAPDQSKHDLRYWDTVTKGFSHLGGKAEWRMKAGKPQALIIRVVTESGSSGSGSTAEKMAPASYLAIAKLAGQGGKWEEICVTNKIESGSDDNRRARQAADASASQTCLVQPNRRK